MPAVTEPAAALTVKWVAAAALTAMAPLVPVMVRGGRVGGRHRLVAGRLQGDAEGTGAAGQRAVGRQAGRAVAAGEMDRAGIAGRRVVELVLGRHRDADGRARRGAAGGADHEVVGRRGADRDALLVPVMVLVAVSVAVTVWLPAVLSVTLNVPVPLVSVALAGRLAAPSLLVKWTVPA